MSLVLKKILFVTVAVFLVVGVSLTTYFCVKPNETVGLTFSANENTVSLKVGEKKQIDLDISNPDAAVTSQGDEDGSVAKVELENRKVFVTGKAVGTTKLTLKCEFGGECEKEEINIIVTKNSSQADDAADSSGETDDSKTDGGDKNGDSDNFGNVEDKNDGGDSENESGDDVGPKQTEDVKPDDENDQSDTSLSEESAEATQIRLKLSYSNLSGVTISDRTITMTAAHSWFSITLKGENVSIDSGLSCTSENVSTTLKSSRLIDLKATQNCTCILTICVNGVNLQYLLIVSL